MAHVFTEADYKLIREMSFRYSRLVNFPVDLREDAAQFSAVKALELARGHDERRCPFRARIIHFTWIWTVRFFSNRNKFWRKNFNDVNVFYSDEPPVVSHAERPDARIDARERISLARAVTNTEWLGYLDYAAQGLTYTEIAARTGVSRQAIQQAFWTVRDRVLEIERYRASA